MSKLGYPVQPCFERLIANVVFKYGGYFLIKPYAYYLVLLSSLIKSVSSLW
jgi:hypothetical protein